MTIDLDPPTVKVDPLAPARLGPITLRNRVIKAATFEGLTPKGLVTDELIDFHRQPAAGGVGMTTVAYCAVAPDGRTAPGQIQWTDETMPGLRKLTDAIHAEGAAVSAQIGHAGPVAASKYIGYPALGPSRAFRMTTQNFSTPATAADITRIVEAHANAARRAVEAGFDAVEIHFGHNYLISSFLSPKVNKRTDEYGGSLANRARFALETARAVRDAVGDRIAILAKLSMDDGVPGGFWVDEAIQVARWLERDGSLDALELTAGSSLLNPMYLFKGDAPLREFAAVMPQPTKLGIRLVGKHFLKEYPYRDAYLLENARQIRAAVTMPLVLLGGITGRATMDLAMAEGFQFVAVARALLREPDLVNRIADETHNPGLCIHCNKCMTAIYGGTHCVLRVP
ncbi:MULTISPECIES: NADH:flavin oxidoreductase [unclassified Rhodococcus (in: high G+C Gram-positive bacteria)]|uniref:NADH:flavin oxidoreductase n=1 Tax=unclassified Rhodococcus (in: high G+C Gram-positive bacteria) TaxID=192944 RepID=UPI00163AF9B5|nr:MULTISPECIES: NADH:flavin oxidoreductase [unclassified Rhodococcus (in: high G+C Gram-positive bacteria)]MBC2643049.1 NADH:flavin oxidoreductase [Rhodococcus sp. 3A]MBC2892209.1 NADH:flavin oxidoreductase [Rhodococcus sp. 4CII]